MWELMSSQNNRQVLADDQTRLNYALRRCGIQWQSMSKMPRLYVKSNPVSGQCSKPPYHKVKIMVLPDSYICRKCTGTTRYYVAHPQSRKEGEAKVETAQKLKFWFLDKDWRHLGRRQVGRNWLAALARQRSSHEHSNKLRTMAL